ncbi:hypothetical protein JMJ77_0010258 [Colletotrichum scovillei]|uniref:Uncharacterized protein n=1 Tax=Colletotrichum scovillei TaxID=1209932 RepID=A0A9P7QSI0_9PEZI|nr:hypothetical protein JMJ78_0011637 [Colletotrichum scovillei]KAG7042155.1 hypothetical protein JMJ77_0010258 [Colletotrichum scovillei]KAG7062188.1 hypothetical protein JMJ76_0006466 [Colletotrichum scovillei]
MGSNDETSYYGGYGAFTPGVQSTAKFANTPAAPTKLTTSSTYTTSVQLTRPTIEGGSSSSEKSTCTGTASILTSSTAAARSPTSRISSAEPAHTPARFAQMVDLQDPILYGVTEEQLLKTSFGDICPSGNCVDDCKNTTRVFQAIPQGLQVDPLRYGRMEDQKANVTLFSTCSNLEFSTNFATAEENVNFTPYFSTNDSTDLFKVAANIASCFVATCEQTRKPTLCADACSPAKLLSSPTTFDYMLGLPDCVVRLCDNTCSLPYVDPDVLGIGVLISYFIQALLLVICATAIMVSAGFQLWKVSQAQPTVRESLRSPLETFVRVQALFGISLAIATLIMRPDEIDPLNGYALILTAIMGFLPPVFTLMLLHSHGVRSRFSTALVFVSYLLNTVTFFILVRNLSISTHDRLFLDKAIDSLFSAKACGGGPAILLCYQLTGTDPVGFLSGFYDNSSFANIKTVPLLWIWTTLVLLVLITRHLVATTQKRSDAVGQLPPAKPQGLDRSKRPSGFHAFLSKPLFTFFILSLATSLFFLCLLYQYLLVRANALMDVVDQKGWSFGQVVALLFWVPPFLDILRSMYEKEKYEKVQNAHESQS